MAERGVVSGTVFVQTHDKPDKKEKKKGSLTRKPLREKNRTGNMMLVIKRHDNYHMTSSNYF